MENEILKKIWDMQSELNKMVGIDSLAIGQNGSHEDKLKWVWNFMDEMRNEAHEAKENFLHKWWVKEVKEDPAKRFMILDIAKVKLEIIDMLHFLISACHVHCFGNFDTCVFEYTGTKTGSDRLATVMDNEKIYRMIGHVSTLKSPNNALGAMTELLKLVGMTDEEVLKIYTMKWEKNKLRQQTGYAQATKTEADNQEIEAKIK